MMTPSTTTSGRRTTRIMSDRASRDGKKQLPKPASFSGFVVVIILFLCKRVLLIKPETRVAVYLFTCLLGSIVGDFFPLPRGYFARKDNLFNQWFVKLSWGWTCSLLFIFIFMTSYTYTCGNVQRVKLHLSRLGISTAMWFVFTKSFVYIEALTGFCTAEEFTTRSACVKNGHTWMGFDISGHTFLLAYCILLIAEESVCFDGWEKIGHMLLGSDKDEDNLDEKLKHLSKNELAQLQDSYANYTVYIKVNFLLLTLLCILWDVMLVATILYFHSLPQKMAALVFAIGCWFSTYRAWYCTELSPGLPGEGLFRYKPNKPSGVVRYSRR